MIGRWRTAHGDPAGVGVVLDLEVAKTDLVAVVVEEVVEGLRGDVIDLDRRLLKVRKDVILVTEIVADLTMNCSSGWGKQVIVEVEFGKGGGRRTQGKEFVVRRIGNFSAVGVVRQDSG